MISAIALASLAGCGGTDDGNGADDGGPTPTPQEEYTPEEDPDGPDDEAEADGEADPDGEADDDPDEQPAEAEPDPIAFSGSGSRVTDEFRIEGGFTTVEFQHGGGSNFIVELLDPAGDRRDKLVANEIGDADGIWGEGVEQGEWVMDVDADGGWEITVQQPRIPEGGGEDLPYEDSGDDFGGVFALDTDGMSRVWGLHEGSGNFIVESWTLEGERHRDTLVFNEIDEFEGETTLRHDGTTWITVEAGGSWELEFE